MKIAIAGFGAEGASNYAYYALQGNHELTIVERANKPIPPGVRVLTDENALANLYGYDLVVRGGSILPNDISTDGKIWSATNEFFEHCPAPIIGVTGTKGKGTTVALIASILSAAGRTVHVVGNIGVPPLDVLSRITKSDIVVFEMSSFQLLDIERSPHVAVVLMIEADHMDIHNDMTEYIGAKRNIVVFQTDRDICLYHPTNEYAAWVASAAPGSTYRYGVSQDEQVYVKDGYFCKGRVRICPISVLQLRGQHNSENACAAISAAWCYTNDAFAIENGLRLFGGLPHRLKLIGTIDGVQYYDDSIATTPGSAIAAIRAFSEPKVIILGGSDKGGNYEDIIELCARTGTTVISVGVTGARIADLCRRFGVRCERIEGGMRDVVAKAREIAIPGSVVLLSPASASFDQYASYSDRGDQFVNSVKELKS